jgi:hypothetical protein
MVLNLTSEIVNDVLFRAGEPIDGSSDFASVALDYLNRAYRALWTGGGEYIRDENEPWLWLRKDPPGVLVLNPVVTAGSATVVQGSASVTLSVAPTASMVGRMFQMVGWRDVFRVIAHTGGSTAMTIDTGYTGVAGTGAFILAQVEYTLATDVFKVVSPMQVQAESLTEIEGIDINALNRDFPLTSLASGTPNRFAMIGEQKIRFNRYGGVNSTDFARAEYEYMLIPPDLTGLGNDAPLVPLQFRQVLADLTLAELYKVKSDDRAEAALTQGRAGVKAMILFNRSRTAQQGRSDGKLVPRPLKSIQQMRVPRTSSGMIVSGW